MWTLEITNTCECGHCTNPDCQLWWERCDQDDKCDECDSPIAPTDCYGACWTDAQTYVSEAVEAWMAANNTEAYYIAGSGMGWTGASGRSDVVTEPSAAIERLSIDSQWILRFTREDDKLTAVRSSHDELGALFEFMPVPNAGNCDSCGNREIVQRYEKHDDVYYWCNNCNEEEE